MVPSTLPIIDVAGLVGPGGDPRAVAKGIGKTCREHGFFEPIHLRGADAAGDDRDQRWDHASVHAFEGTYGDYVLGKIGRVFPGLGRSVL